MAFPTIASLCLPITTTKEEGFYVELFFICAFPLELEPKREFQAQKKNIYENRKFSKGYIKICETGAKKIWFFCEL